MRTSELISLMPTQYRRVSEDNPLRVGHHMPVLGYWTVDEGYVKKQSLNYQGEVLACPIIAVVDTKIGNKDLEMTITGKVAQYDHTVDITQGDHTLERKIYVDSESTIETTLIVPRFTRPRATFLITGLGNKVFEIEDIVVPQTLVVGKVTFYALASNGSKIIYWFGMFQLANQLREILRPWIAPTKCNRCNGTGIEPGTESGFCAQCEGYRFSGYSSTKQVQRNLGFDVGLAREILDWDNLTDEDHDLIFKFINKAWTQKWWVTPTKKEIIRLFAHFYNLPEANIVITERFNLQEPIWTILLPTKGSSASIFGTLSESDNDLMRFIAKSVTPAGVSVFVGFYEEYFLGDLTGISDDLFFSELFPSPQTSMEHNYALIGCPRWDFWNGWTEATDDFERETGVNWALNGTVDIVNVNDMNRRMVELTDNSYMETGVVATSGSYELWFHKQATDIRVGQRDTDPAWMFYVEAQGSGIYDNDSNLLSLIKEDCDHHLRLDFDDSQLQYDVYLDEELIGSGINYIGSGTIGNFRIESIGTGKGYIDNVILPDDTGHQVGDNLQRLYPHGWGIRNQDFATGVTGTVYDLFNTYFLNDRFFDLNI
ncbi:MAG: zinc finger-like domain-containing protein [Saprospiraceae bacterium]